MKPMTNRLLVNIYIQKYFSFISTSDLKQTNNLLGPEASLMLEKYKNIYTYLELLKAQSLRTYENSQDAKSLFCSLFK